MPGSVSHRKLVVMDPPTRFPISYPMTLKETVKPSGSAWVVDQDDPATLPVPLPVMIVKIEGRYTERDRKLWNFLIHAVWDALGKSPIHELNVPEINRIFRKLGGEHDTAWLWDSAKRLTRTVVEWQYTQGDTRYEGISSIFGAVLSKEMQAQDRLRFEIPALLVEIIKNPNRFSRVRLHFMMSLSGKYAVTLYEILESAANRRDPVLVVPLNELRQWLNVSAEKYPVWYDFKKWILDPAIKQINNDPVAAGFSVDMEPLRQSRAIDASASPSARPMRGRSSRINARARPRPS